jgi:putative phosphoribosyl transferase
VLDVDRARELIVSSLLRQLGSSCLFEDRFDAGEVLARELELEAGVDAVVVGLARGGIVVGAAVARVLGLPLGPVAVRKIRHPFQPEYALGAVAPGAPAYVRARDGLTDRELAFAVRLARADADRLDRTLRDGRPQPSLVGLTAVVVDDGLATGATMIAAVRWADRRGASRIVAAAPVGARETVDLLRREADEVVCPNAVDDLGAVGLWYADFSQVDDEEVGELLRTSRGSAR